MSIFTTKDSLAFLELLAKGFTIRDTTAMNTFVAAIPELVVAARERNTLQNEFAAAMETIDNADKERRKLLEELAALKKPIETDCQICRHPKDVHVSDTGSCKQCWKDHPRGSDIESRCPGYRFDDHEALRSLRAERDAAKTLADHLNDRVKQVDNERSALATAVADVHEVFNTLLDIDGEHTTGGTPAQRLQALLYQHKTEIDRLEATAEDARTVCEWVVAQGDKQRPGYVADWSVIGLAARRVLGQLPPRPADCADCAGCAKSTRSTDGAVCVLHGRQLPRPVEE